MTEGQIKYQTLMENQRHNLEVEKYNAQQAEASLRQASAAEANAQTNLYKAQVEEKKVAMEYGMRQLEHQAQVLHWSNETRINWYRTGAAMMGGLMGAVGTIGNLIA